MDGTQLNINNKENNDIYGGLVLEPSNELRFKGPFTDVVTVNLTIRNPTSKRVAFKIKTTAPKKYCVKPNSGVLDPTGTMKVSVLLQPFNFDPNEKGKHKFMVQYLYLNEQETSLSSNDIINLWKDFSQDRLLDIKLKCLFEQCDSIKEVSVGDQSSLSRQMPSTSASLGSTQSSAALARTSDVSLVTTKGSDSNNISFSNDLTNDQMVDSETTLGNNVFSNKDQLDNILNENRALKSENNRLKSESLKLKEETNQLKKRILSNDTSKSSSMASSSSSLAQKSGSRPDELLNNRLVLIIIALVAMNLYLMFFK